MSMIGILLKRFFCYLFLHIYWTQTVFKLSFTVCIAVCLFIPHWLEVQGDGLDLTQHVKPSRMFVPVISPEPLAFVSPLFVFKF